MRKSHSIIYYLYSNVLLGEGNGDLLEVAIVNLRLSGKALVVKFRDDELKKRNFVPYAQ